MLSELFESPARIRTILGGPAGVEIEGFAEQLFRCGYSKISIRRHIRSAEHIVRWATRRSLSLHDLGGRAFKRFVDHLGRCRCGRYHCANRVDVAAGARLFLSHLQGVKEPPARDRQIAPAELDLLAEFWAWMRERRGTSDRALYNYSIPIRELIRRISGDPKALDARRLRRFVLKQSKGVGGQRTWGDYTLTFFWRSVERFYNCVTEFIAQSRYRFLSRSCTIELATLIGSTSRNRPTTIAM